MLEEMGAFFENRLEGYDEHMLRDILGAKEFYPFTASLLPDRPGARVLDLGCGTGLELEFFFERNPDAAVTGIDLSEGMLNALREKYPDKDLTLIRGSYFDVPLGTEVFDAAVSVESLHHFTAEQKLGLYIKLRESLKEGGCFVLTDFFAESDEQEKEFFDQLRTMREEQGIDDSVFYHFDTPLTAAHEIEVLYKAGFKTVEIKRTWGATYTLLAVR